MKPYLWILFSFLLSACTESSVEIVSGPALFSEYDFYFTEAKEENRAGIREVDIIWKEATFGKVTAQPVFQHHQLKEVELENGEINYWLTAISSDNCVDIASKLEKTEDGFIIGVTRTGKMCACIGCAEGCKLTLDGVDCRCETYTPSDNNCEKLEMVEVEM